jgi:hypothetical protein
MSRILTALLVAGTLLMCSVPSQANLIQNGDFGSGLAGWTTWGSVTASSGAATLGDTTSAGLSGLSQTFYLSPGTTGVSISFDYLFGGTDTTSRYSDIFSSTFAFASSVLPFINLNNLVWTLSSSAQFGSVLHFNAFYTITNLVNVNPNALISFNLTELAGFLCQDGTNTSVRIDNVNVAGAPAPVPEPATLLLLGSGLLGLAGTSRLRRRAKKS